MNVYDIKSTEEVEVGRFHIIKHKIETKEGLSPYSYVKIKNGVAVIPVMNDKILLIRQYRLTINSWEWEIPAGFIEEEELPRDAACRELMEETGYTADRLIDLGDFYPSCGSTDEKIYLYAAECSKKLEQKLDATEKIIVEMKTKDEVIEMVRQNQIKHGAGLTALFKYLLHSDSNHFNISD